jgi:hypothetical protein
MSNHQTLRGSPRYTYLPELAGGPSPSNSQGGLQMSLPGLGAARVSRSARPERGEESTTQGTSGLSSSASLRSVNLQLSLENRLRVALEGRGSQEYELTWKRWDMESGPSILAQRASQHRISDKGSGGWPTPRTITGGAESAERKQQLGRSESGGGDLQAAAQAAGWGTLTSRDHKDSPGQSVPTNGFLGRQALESGTTQSQSPASTASRGVLNPELPRWLMGFPAEWGNYAPTATPSSRRSRHSS